MFGAYEHLSYSILIEYLQHQFEKKKRKKRKEKKEKNIDFFF